MNDAYAIPEATMETLQAWVDSARPVGGFVEAVLRNDLKEAFRRADESNIAAMFHIVAWLYNEAPYGCWGSDEAYEAWPAKVKRRENVC